MTYAEKMNIRVVNDYAMTEPVVAQFCWTNINSIAYWSGESLEDLISRVSPADDSIVAIWKVKRKVNDAYWNDAKALVTRVAKSYRTADIDELAFEDILIS